MPVISRYKLKNYGTPPTRLAHPTSYFTTTPPPAVRTSLAGVGMEQEHIQTVLEQSRNAFIDEEPIRMLPDSVILQDLRASIPVPSGPLQHVNVGRVGTYIYQTELSKTTGNMRIIFPTFASHWAVMVFDTDSPQQDGHGYHLTFQDPDAAQLTPPPSTSREVVFMGTLLESMPDGMKEVGTTRFSHPDRMKIGRAMIKAFGSYHRVFWNCQHFARLYLKVITDGLGAFDEWTLSQTSNLFLCAFVVTTPIAATNKKIETRKARQILAQFPSAPSNANERMVLDASDEAMTLAQRLAIEDYTKNHPNEVRVERRGPLRDMLDRFKVLVDSGYKWVSG